MRSLICSVKSIVLMWLLIVLIHPFATAQNEKSKERTYKNVAIIYYDENLTGENESSTINLFTKDIFENFPVVEKIRITKWKDGNDLKLDMESEVFDSLHIDAFYRLNFKLKSGEIYSVTPTLVLRNNTDGKTLKITLPVYSTDYYKDINFRQYVINELSGFANSFFNINQSDITKFNTTSHKAATLYPLAEKSASTDDYSRSDFFLNLLLEKNNSLDAKDEVKAINLLGNNKIKLYRIDEAEEEFNKALAVLPGNYAANFGIAKVRVERGDWDGALFKANSLTPATMEVYLLRGQAYIGRNDFENAERSFRNITKSNPDLYLKKLLFLGSIYLETEETEKAYEIYKELYQIEPSNSDIAYLYGYLLGLKGIDEFNEGNYRTAVDLLTEADQVYSTSDVSDYLRRALINEHKFDKALDLINEKIQQGDYDSESIYLVHALDIRTLIISDTSITRDETNLLGDQIIRAIDLHLKYNPDDPTGYLYKGNTLTRMGRNDEGLAQLEIAFNKNTLDRNVQLDLMESYLLNDKPEKCEGFYAKVMRKNKRNKVEDSDRYEALMNYLLISSLKVQNKKYKKPQKKLNKLFKSGVIVDRWSYNSYLKWLNNSNYDAASKTFLLDLTDKMKSHTYKG